MCHVTVISCSLDKLQFLKHLYWCFITAARIRWQNFQNTGRHVTLSAWFCLFIPNLALTPADNNSMRCNQNTIFFRCRSSTILNLQNFKFSSRDHSRNQIMHLHTKLRRNQLICVWLIAIKPFSIWRSFAISNYLKFGHVTCVCAWFCFFIPNLVLIRQ